MPRSRTAALRRAVAALAVPALAPAALAAHPVQNHPIEPVVLYGDVVPGVGQVVGIVDIDVNVHGRAVVEANTDFPDEFQNTVVLDDGELIYREGQTLADPADHGINSIGPVTNGPNGDVLTTLYVWPQLGGLNFELVHVDGFEMLRTGDSPLGPFLPTAWEFAAFEEARINASDQVLLQATLDDGAQFVEALVVYETNSIGQPTAEVPVVVEGDTIAGLFGQQQVEDIVGGPNARAWTDTGVALYQVNLTGPAASEIVWLVNGSVVAQEGAPSPIPGRTWTNLLFRPGDVNDAGVSVIVGEVSGDPATRHVISLLGAKYAQSGDPVPGVPGATILSFGQTAPIFVDDSNTVLWTADWIDGGLVSGLFHGYTPLAIEGVTKIGGQTITDLYTFQDGFVLAPDGTTALFRATLEDGTQGVFRATLDGALEEVPGCFANAAQLTSDFAPPGPGDPLLVTLDGNPYGVAGASIFASGGAILPGNPCGVPLGGAGELLISVAPPLKQVFATVALGATEITAPILVPDDPSFAGVEFWLQGLWLSGSPTEPEPLTLSTAIRVVVTD